MMKPRLWTIPLLLAPVLLAGACGSLLPEPAESPRTIDFGPSPEFAGADRFAGPVALAGIDAPRWLGDNHIHYRRLDTAPNTLARYARHVWAAPPPELLAEHVDAMLRARSPDDTSPADGDRARLELRLTRFEQAFESPERAHVDVRITAVLHRRDGGRSTQQEFRARVDTSPDVDGAIRGLPAAADTLVHQIGDWLAREVRAPGS